MGKTVFFGGLPTEPDVKRLRESFPPDAMRPGQIITYEEVSEIIASPYPSSRFDCVTGRWKRNLEKETNIILGTKPGEAFVVLSEPEKVELAGRRLREGGRKARRAWVVAQRTDRAALSQEQIKALDHQIGVSSKIIASAQLRNGRKQLPDV